MSEVSGAAFDPQGLDRLRQAAREESPDALREAARQFEALFIHSMLKNMRETGFGEGLFDNDQTRMYQGMFDQQIAGNMAAGGGIGLAEVLVRQLGGDRIEGAAASRAYEEAARIEKED
ncbi:MAG: rod-binding protein [Gammaproteobacteria bacterium]|jgi:flagellar protein FlgJ|nr:rod-binding protein [Gammaproteobacteria bacterium]